MIMEAMQKEKALKSKKSGAWRDQVPLVDGALDAAGLPEVDDVPPDEEDGDVDIGRGEVEESVEVVE